MLKIVGNIEPKRWRNEMNKPDDPGQFCAQLLLSISDYCSLTWVFRSGRPSKLCLHGENQIVQPGKGVHAFIVCAAFQSPIAQRKVQL